ncbi:MAG TPA: DUF4337 domain-containing protein [Steroidobacteraceae bacterium]|nr:DUF4337 domain-containing protein [Steroidobacteraceae bacterium]
MAEVEIHTGHGHEADDFGRGVGIMVGIIGIVLALATIGAHRAHTATIITRTEANDKWAFYQAKKERAHLQEVGAELAAALGNDPARIAPVIEKFHSDEQRYQRESEDLIKEARGLEDEVKHLEGRAQWLDLSEGFLELGLVLSSLYFLARRRFFPLIGGTAAAVGAALALYGVIL